MRNRKTKGRKEFGLGLETAVPSIVFCIPVGTFARSLLNYLSLDLLASNVKWNIATGIGNY